MPRATVLPDWLRGRSGDARRFAQIGGSGSQAHARQPGNQRLPDDVLRLVFDRSPIGIAVSGLDGRWIWVNESCRQMLGYDDEQLVGAASSDVTHADDLLFDQQFVAASLAGERDSAERDKRYRCSDGSFLWTRVLAQLIRDDAEQPLYFVSHLQDVSERRHAQDLLHDSERTLRSVIDNTPATISVKDRDHRYTLVNREFEQSYGLSGHQIIGRTDTDLLPAGAIDDIHARDLAVLETGQTTQEEIISVAEGRERLLLVSRFPLRDEAGLIHGVCTAETDITERRAEERSRRERLECSELIYSALAEHRFVLHGQPIVRLDSGALEASELLIRMRKSRANGELVSPASFLPAAERFDLIGLIDEWVLGQAIDLGACGHRVGVNVSAKTISDPRHVDRIEALLAGNPTAAQNLGFELTETAVAGDLDAARSFAIRIRRLGCVLALDDFGIGHGSFTYLRHLPVDFLKIDAQFVRNLRSDEEDRQVVQAIVGVARQFGIETIAEGVEDEATLVELSALGVDFAQGYVIGRPLPLEECWALTEKRPSGDTHVTPG